MRYEFIFLTIIFLFLLLFVFCVLMLIAAFFYKVFWMQTFGRVTNVCKISKERVSVYGDDGSGMVEYVVKNKPLVECELNGEIKKVETKFSYGDFWVKIFFPEGKKLKVAYKDKGNFRYFIYREFPALFCSALPFIAMVFIGFILLAILVLTIM